MPVHGQGKSVKKVGKRRNNTQGVWCAGCVVIGGRKRRLYCAVRGFGVVEGARSTDIVIAKRASPPCILVRCAKCCVPSIVCVFCLCEDVPQTHVCTKAPSRKKKGIRK